MIFASANGVLATQSLLHAMGMGFATALPLSAGINWILKDGCGQLLAIYFASNISKGFDANVKKWRMNSAIFYELSILMECLTPIVCSLLPPNVKPVAFLFCASIANAGKNICWMSSSASKAHIHKYMCMNDNMADITAKAVSQAIVCSLSGTMIGICFSLLNIIGYPSIFLVYCSLATCHLLSVHRSLVFIHDPLLNEMRARTLAKQFIGGDVLLMMPSEIDDNVKHKNVIVINERISQIFKQSPDILLDIIQRFRDETSLKYWMYWNCDKLYVWFDIDASSVNVLHCILCATHFLNGVEVGSDGFDDENIWKSIIYANENCEKWVECLQKSGWNVENLFIELEKDRICL